MAKWHVHHGKYWMLQSCFSGWVSFGIHLDFKSRKTGKEGISYGPYTEVHFLWFILSVGVNPYYGTYD